MADQAQTPERPDAAASVVPASSSGDLPATRDDRIETVRVRRSPKYSVFFIAGAALGVIAALILTFAFHGSEQPTASGVVYSQAQVFGFLALICITVGVALGGVVALLFDRALARRAHDVTVDHESVHIGG